MHFVFIPYGERREIEWLFRDMEAQKHKLHMTKGKKKMYMWIPGQVRQLPMGAYEYICPKEDADTVMTTLQFDGYDSKERYKIGNLKLTALRKLYKCEKIPEFKKDKKYVWIKGFVNIIPIGIRYDDENQIEPEGKYKGWFHEAL